eukprot:scaffold13513_cov130-Isochrysis_galbana.AAC.1
MVSVRPGWSSADGRCDPINRPYTVGCALNTALKQALSQPKQPTSTSSRTASDSVGLCNGTGRKDNRIGKLGVETTL